MSLRDGPFQDIRAPIIVTAVIAVVVAGLIALALVLSDRRETVQGRVAGGVGQAVDRVEQPVLSVLSAPVRWIGSGVDGVRGYFFAVSENRRLRANQRDMDNMAAQLAALRIENGRLSALLGLRTSPPIDMVAGHAVLESRGPFANSRLVDVGSKAGVAVGNPAMNERGVLGRVVGVTPDASRVLLLTDITSRVPVLIARTDARAILSGDGGPNPSLGFLRGDNPVRPGDLVLTAGDGGVFPRGLPVGVAARGLDGAWRVELGADRGGVSAVRLLKFHSFVELVDRADLDHARMPPTGQPPAAPSSKPAPAGPAKPAGAP